jgi:uncharacterized protein
MADPRDRFACAEFIEALRADPDVRIEPSSTTLFDNGLQYFTERLVKQCSLTVCISFVVMEKESRREALTGDHHFEQAGFVTLLK